MVSARCTPRLGFGRDGAWFPGGGAWFLVERHEEVGELTQAFLVRTGRARDEGTSAEDLEEDFRTEPADVVCHALLLARSPDADVERAIEDKWQPRFPRS